MLLLQTLFFLLDLSQTHLTDGKSLAMCFQLALRFFQLATVILILLLAGHCLFVVVAFLLQHRQLSRHFLVVRQDLLEIVPLFHLLIFHFRLQLIQLVFEIANAMSLKGRLFLDLRELGILFAQFGIAGGLVGLEMGQLLFVLSELFVRRSLLVFHLFGDAGHLIHELRLHRSALGRQTGVGALQVSNDLCRRLAVARFVVNAAI
mmetsp:Transcript_64773/g.97584  ORF Transcript_64773/g.97584 Transcript_64773/m.97584 type:complete len:205 (+) Transcript_64773:2142-2756(+)